MSESVHNGVNSVSKDLSTFIKSVHRNLRERVKNSGDAESVWSDHCRNESGLLTQYSEAMRCLATDVWPKQHHVTRIDWCVNTCREYFLKHGLQRVRDKESRRRVHLRRGCGSDSNKFTADVVHTMELRKEESGCNVNDKHKQDNITIQVFHECDSSQLFSLGVDKSIPGIVLPLKGKIRLLDVGSCYDPFQQFDDFLAFGVDICPAASTVFKCDLLRVDIIDPLPSSAAVDSYFDSLHDTSPADRHSVGLTHLVSESFHVVVFSLLLEYLPTSRQRVLCCQSAWRLLAVDGLLVIVTPDSRRQHRNGRVANDWRRDIESIGFARWRYEKLEHVHCMAFRKIVVDVEVGRLVPGSPSSVDALRIPQDNNVNEDKFEDSVIRSACVKLVLPSDEQPNEQLIDLLPIDYCYD